MVVVFFVLDPWRWQHHGWPSSPWSREAATQTVDVGGSSDSESGVSPDSDAGMDQHRISKCATCTPSEFMRAGAPILPHQLNSLREPTIHGRWVRQRAQIHWRCTLGFASGREQLGSTPEQQLGDLLRRRCRTQCIAQMNFSALARPSCRIS